MASVSLEDAKSERIITLSNHQLWESKVYFFLKVKATMKGSFERRTGINKCVSNIIIKDFETHCPK